MTQRGERLARDYARAVERRVKEVRAGTERLVRRSDYGWRTDAGRLQLAQALRTPVLMNSAQALGELGTFVGEYTAAEEAPPPAVRPPAAPSAETEESVAQLALVARGVYDRVRARRDVATRERALMAVVLGGAVARRALADSRRWQRNYLTRDPSVVAYRRVPDSDPCYFCAMLAARGYVYRTRESAGDTRVVEGWHDACGCTAQALYRGQQPTLDSVAIAAQDIYEASTGQASGKGKITAFRAAWENRGGST